MPMMKVFPKTWGVDTVSQRGPALLFVNVTWCGYCVSTKPVMEEVAQVLGSVVPVYSVDAEEREDVARELKVASYPTIIYVSESGAKFRYTGERTLDALTSFVCHNSASRHSFCRKIR